MKRCLKCGRVRADAVCRYCCNNEVDHYGPEVVPDHPTQAPPGSETKIKEMIRRVELGMEVDHPNDVKLRKRQA